MGAGIALRVPQYGPEHFRAAGRGTSLCNHLAELANGAAQSFRDEGSASALASVVKGSDLPPVRARASYYEQPVGRLDRPEDIEVIDPIRTRLHFDKEWRGSLGLSHRDESGAERYAGELVLQNRTLVFRAPSAQRAEELAKESLQGLERSLARGEAPFWESLRAFLLAAPYGERTAEIAEPLFAGTYAAIFRKRWDMTSKGRENLASLARVSKNGEEFHHLVGRR